MCPNYEDLRSKFQYVRQLGLDYGFIRSKCVKIMDFKINFYYQ